jgi:hypothetical protein
LRGDRSEGKSMTALRDIFTYALPGSVFLFASAVFLLLCAAA